VQFRDFMGEELDANFRAVEWWTDRATLHPEQAIVKYAKGALVMHDGALYRALAANSEAKPDVSVDVWEHLDAPADDTRPVAGSAYAAMGVRTP
jgi:hypothetical protein